MAPTAQGSMIGRYEGTAAVSAFTNPQHLDLVQIIQPNDGTVIYNIDYTGTAHNPALTPTGQALLGKFSGATIAAAFFNPSQLDLLQVINPHDGTVSYWTDYLGASHGT